MRLVIRLKLLFSFECELSRGKSPSFILPFPFSLNLALVYLFWRSTLESQSSKDWVSGYETRALDLGLFDIENNVTCNELVKNIHRVNSRFSFYLSGVPVYSSFILSSCFP